MDQLCVENLSSVLLKTQTGKIYEVQQVEELLAGCKLWDLKIAIVVGLDW